MLIMSLLRLINRKTLIWMGLMMAAGACRSTDPITSDLLVLAGPAKTFGTTQTFGFRVPVEFRNTGTHPVYLSRCGPEIDKRVGDSWELAFPALCLAVEEPPIVLLPGAAAKDTTSIERMRDDPFLRPLQELPATFRARFAVFFTYDPNAEPGLRLRDRLPEHATTSNSFVVQPE
jgi:hypothetical protein